MGYVMTYESGLIKCIKQDTLGLIVRLISKGLFVVNETRIDSFIKSAMMETERGNKLWLEIRGKSFPGREISASREIRLFF